MFNSHLHQTETQFHSITHILSPWRICSCKHSRKQTTCPAASRLPLAAHIKIPNGRARAAILQIFITTTWRRPRPYDRPSDRTPSSTLACVCTLPGRARAFAQCKMQFIILFYFVHRGQWPECDRHTHTADAPITPRMCVVRGISAEASSQRKCQSNCGARAMWVIAA